MPWVISRAPVRQGWLLESTDRTPPSRRAVATLRSPYLHCRESRSSRHALPCGRTGKEARRSSFHRLHRLSGRRGDGVRRGGACRWRTGPCVVRTRDSGPHPACQLLGRRRANVTLQPLCAPGVRQCGTSCPIFGLLASGRRSLSIHKASPAALSALTATVALTAFAATVRAFAVAVTFGTLATALAPLTLHFVGVRTAARAVVLVSGVNGAVAARHT